MEKKSEVILFGKWSSSYCIRVELALKIKGIPYEYVEEDLKNKSELLLKYNPVMKKVPVLVHKGRAIAESLLILEYIDEHWNNAPKILPDDPYERAKVRFWANFFDQKLGQSSLEIIKKKGEEREKAIDNFSELFRAFEEGIKRDFPGKLFLYNDKNTPGYLDIVVSSSGCNYEAFGEFTGVNPDPENYPTFMGWLNELKKCPLMKETLPPHEKLVAEMRKYFPQAPPN